MSTVDERNKQLRVVAEMMATRNTEHPNDPRAMVIAPEDLLGLLEELARLEGALRHIYQRCDQMRQASINASPEGSDGWKAAREVMEAIVTELPDEPKITFTETDWFLIGTVKAWQWLRAEMEQHPDIRVILERPAVTPPLAPPPAGEGENVSGETPALPGGE